MEKRVCKRIPVNLAVTYFCCNKTLSGTVTNISENGMFIRTREMCIPHDSQLDVQIPHQNQSMKLSANLVRITMSSESDGLGVLLKDPSENYLSYIESLRTQELF